MAPLFPQGKLNQPILRRPASLFPPSDEMDILSEEKARWDADSEAAMSLVNRDNLVEDGSVNWWEMLVPLLTMGIGAAFGGGRGALLGGTAGAGFLQGRVEADERFRKQRQMDAILRQQSEDRKMGHAIDAAKALYERNPQASIGLFLKVFDRAGAKFTPEEVGQLLNADVIDKPRQEALRAHINNLKKLNTPESWAEATRLEIQGYKTLYLRPATFEDQIGLLNTGTAAIKASEGDAEKKRVELEKMRLDLETAKLEAGLLEISPETSVVRVGPDDTVTTIREGKKEQQKIPPTVQAKMVLLRAINRKADNLISDIGPTAEGEAKTEAQQQIQEFMGPVWGSVAGISSKFLGAAGLPQPVVKFMSGVEDLADQWLRERTGAQANESEIDKASNIIMANMRLNPQAAITRLQSVKEFNTIKIQEYGLGVGTEAVTTEQALRELDAAMGGAASQEGASETEEDLPFFYDPNTGLWQER